jgi:histidine triad (HIT) family protein
MTDTCLFCRIVRGEIPADVVLDRDDVLAFRDIDPKAPTHVLVIPKRHVRSVSEVTADMSSLAGSLLVAVRDVAQAEGVSESGFRVVTNAGHDGGQAVDHLHFHVLGGRPLGWPPG